MALFKLGYFVLERVAEPLSRSIEAIASRSPTFRKGCVSLARGFERRQADRYNRFLKPGEKLHKDELSDEQAIKRGAELLGEGMLWLTGISILLHQNYDEERQGDEQAVIDDMKRKQSELIIKEHVTSSEMRIMARIEALNRRIDKLLPGEEKNSANSSSWPFNGVSSHKESRNGTHEVINQHGDPTSEEKKRIDEEFLSNDIMLKSSIEEKDSRKWWKWF